MRYSLLIIFLSLITFKIWAAPINCQQDLNCFINAIKSCSQAQVFLQENGQTSEVSYQIKRQMIIHGPVGQKCLYQDLVQNLTIDLLPRLRQEVEKKGWTEDLISGQTDSIARSNDWTKGLTRECEMTTTELIRVITESFIQKKEFVGEWKNCKKEILKEQIQKEFVREKVIVEEPVIVEEEEEIEWEIPNFLEYPYRYNAITYLKNSIAEISPYLGKKVATHSTSASLQKEPPSKKYKETEVVKEVEVVKEIEFEEDGVTPKKINPLGGNVTVMKELSLFFKPLGPVQIPTPTTEYSKTVEPITPSLPETIPFSKLNKEQRLQLILHGHPKPTGKPRLNPMMTYEEMSRAGYSNEQIGEFVMKKIADQKKAFEKLNACSNGCPSGTHCQSLLKKCVQCITAGDCPGSQICLNYSCVSGDTVLKPQR